ncbi:MAG: hypothetical protein AAGB15_04065, partial [Pseudomonadota bacterium]
MPPRLTYPGVYVVEQASGVRTVTGVATSTTLFIGMTQKGPLGRPTPVRTADQFDDTFGGSTTYGEMAMQVRQFFLNGGAEAIIVRATGEGAAAADAAAVSLTTEGGDAGGGASTVLRLQAKDAGGLSNELRAIVDYDTPTPELTFNIEVFRRSVDANGATVISDNEFFADCSIDPGHPRFVNTVLATQSALVEADTDAVPTPTPGVTQRGFSQSGLVLTGTNAIGSDAGDDTTAMATITGLLAGGSSIRIQLGNGAPVTAILPPGPATFTDWRDAAVAAINGALGAASQPGSVAITTEAFGAGRCLRISSASADAPESVIITPAGLNDGSGALQLGTASGGVEIGTYSRFRPAASGYVTRISTAANDAFTQNTNLSRLNALAGDD